MTTAAIVVGIDGSDSARQAVVWAAWEAARRQITLVIAHVAPDLPAVVAQARASAQVDTATRVSTTGPHNSCHTLLHHCACPVAVVRTTS